MKFSHFILFLVYLTTLTKMVHSEKNLKKLKVMELRDVLSNLGADPEGLTKPKLIEAILEKQQNGDGESADPAESVPNDGDIGNILDADADANADADADAMEDDAIATSTAKAKDLPTLSLSSTIASEEAALYILDPSSNPNANPIPTLSTIFSHIAPNSPPSFKLPAGLTNRYTSAATAINANPFHTESWSTLITEVKLGRTGIVGVLEEGSLSSTIASEEAALYILDPSSNPNANPIPTLSTIFSHIAPNSPPSFKLPAGLTNRYTSAATAINANPFHTESWSTLITEVKLGRTGIVGVTLSSTYIRLLRCFPTSGIYWCELIKQWEKEKVGSETEVSEQSIGRINDNDNYNDD